MTGEAEVSIVLPLYNRARCVGRAVASVLAQRAAGGAAVPPWELIVVDDGSEDDGAAVVEAFGDPRIQIIRRPVNRGAAAARNVGVAAARGDFVAFIDSDDEWTPDKLATQTAAMRAVDAPAATCAGFLLRRADGAEAERRPTAVQGVAGLLDGCFVAPGSTLMARRDCLLAVGPFDESLTRLEDWDWLLRMAESRRLVCLDAVLAVVHAGGFPSYEAVSEAAGRLLAGQRERVLRAVGPAGWRRFRATMQIERGVAALRGGRRWLAAAHLLRAAWLSPARVATLFGRLKSRTRRKAATS